MKNFVVPASLALLAALLTVALAGYSTVPASSAEQSVADAHASNRSTP